MDATTHPNELLISFGRGDVQRGLPLQIRPIDDVSVAVDVPVAVDVHPRHAEGRAEEVLLRRTIGRGY